MPFYNAAGAFVTEEYTAGTANPEFNASFGKLLYLPLEYTRREADLLLRIFPSLDGFPLLHLHDLCAPHQSRLRWYLLLPGPRLWMPRWRILEPRSGQGVYCIDFAQGWWCLLLRRVRSWMVDLLRHLARFARLPVPASR